MTDHEKKSVMGFGISTLDNFFIWEILRKFITNDVLRSDNKRLHNPH